MLFLIGPNLIGQYENNTGNTRDVHIVGRYAYVADDSIGLEIIDISDPTAPFKVGQFDGMGATDIFVNSTLVYIVDGSNDLKVLDISLLVIPKPLNPTNYYNLLCTNSAPHL